MQDLERRHAGDVVEYATVRALHHLTEGARAKWAHLPQFMVPGADFSPIVISPGGLIEKDT
jgi:hypothetical protein